MGNFTWIDKEPVQNWSGGKVVGMNYSASKTRDSDGKTAYTGGCEAFAREDYKLASYWTEEKIDEHAEEWRITHELDNDLDTQLSE